MADSDLDHAADDIRWLGARFKGLIAAADALKDFGSISNAIREKDAIHADLVSQIKAAQTTLADLKTKIEQTNQDHGAATARLAEVEKAHRDTTALLHGALKGIKPAA